MYWVHISDKLITFQANPRLELMGNLFMVLLMMMGFLGVAAITVKAINPSSSSSFTSSPFDEGNFRFIINQTTIIACIRKNCMHLRIKQSV